MIIELGHFALILALCLALLQGTAPLWGAQRGSLQWMALAIPAARTQGLFVLIAYACLTYAFIEQDYSVLYVAQHSNSALPLPYRIAAVWGAHEGSLLFAILLLAIWTLAITHFNRSLPPAFLARVLAILGLISSGFLLFTLFTSNPFERLFPVPPDGHDLNPLLQDPGFVLHPPMLYIGYIGLAVPFAFAVAALLEGRIDAAWIRWTRPWTLLAWVFLTLGITLGSWWAYYELGWGGWWFWDPVENASFMPWLIATALIHSLAVSEQRLAFKAWTVLLAIFGFSLSLLGTFLVRSGVLVSVHTFASDPARGVFILAFLAVVIGSALSLYAWRANAISGGGYFKLMSRETLLLINNVFLVVSCAAVLLGTLYPLVLDALQLGKISVGPPYFNLVFIALMTPVLLILGLGPLTRWKQDRLPPLLRQLLPAFVLSLLFAVLFILFAAVRGLGLFLALCLAGWILFSSLQLLYTRLQGKQNPFAQLRRTPRHVLGMCLAHCGVAVFIIGVAMVSTQEVEKHVRMQPGDSETIGDYRFRFMGVNPYTGPNYQAQRGELHVFKQDREITRLYPEKRVYLRQGNPMTEAAIDSSITRDLYVSLGEALDEQGAWALRIYQKPFVMWIWLGPVLMALGGLLAASDRRYRLARYQTDWQNTQQTPASTALPDAAQ